MPSAQACGKELVFASFSAMLVSDSESRPLQWVYKPGCRNITVSAPCCLGFACGQLGRSVAEGIMITHASGEYEKVFYDSHCFANEHYSSFVTPGGMESR